MARPLRIEYPGAVYRVMNRGRARHPVFRDPPDERLVRGLLQPQRSSRLIHLPHRLPQRPARGRQHEDVIHIPDVPPAALCHLHIQRIQIGLTQQTA